MNEPINLFPNKSRGALPSAACASPEAVVNAEGMTIDEKKALLASWVSDARSVENAPTLRRLDSGEVVEVAAVLRALAALDRPARGKTKPRVRRDGRVIWLRPGRTPSNGNDNGDDPPPAPAGVAIPFSPTFVVAQGAPPEKLRQAAWGAR